MCKLASFVIVKGPKAYWLAKSDSHEEIIRSVGLYESPQTNIVRTEIAPPNRDLSLPLDQWVYRVDQPNTPDWYDAESCERECRLALADWAKVKLAGWKVHEAFHPINPLLLKAKRIPKKQLLKLLQSWTSVRDSVFESTRDSMFESVRVSVFDPVRESVFDSVFESAWTSVRDSVRDSVWTYAGGLFPNIKVWKCAETLGPDPWRPLLILWYAGYVPSFDGKTWRLHAGKGAKVVLTWTPKGKAVKG